MTNFIYNMQDEIFHLPIEDFSTIKKLVDHIEAQGKQLRELNAAITKRNATIDKYERENKDLRERNTYLIKKVQELNEGIRDSEDLTWKQKYDALLQSSEQAIGALQKKCQEYKNSESDATASTIAENLKKLKDYISELEYKVKGLEAANEKLLARDRVRNCVISLSSELNAKIDNQSKEITRLLKAQEKLKAEMVNKEQIISSLDATINHKNKLLDEYMTKCNNLEHNYNEEVRMKEQFKMTCFKHERTIESQNSTIKKIKEENEKLKKETNTYRIKFLRSACGCNDAEETIKNLKRDNDILRGKVNEISDLAESILMLCDDEE